MNLIDHTHMLTEFGVRSIKVLQSLHVHRGTHKLCFVQIQDGKALVLYSKSFLQADGQEMRSYFLYRYCSRVRCFNDMPLGVVCQWKAWTK